MSKPLIGNPKKTKEAIIPPKELQTRTISLARCFGNEITTILRILIGGNQTSNKESGSTNGKNPTNNKESGSTNGKNPTNNKESGSTNGKNPTNNNM